MLGLDGSTAGGQFLRSALALSILTEEPIRITDIRGGRSPGGLRPQHHAVVEVLSDIVYADTTGVELGSEQLTFEPREVQGGAYTADIGTAGSITLLFDAVLPLATVLDISLRVDAHGGTAVEHAPPLGYHHLVKLPVLRNHGLMAAADRHATGFFPAGGGHATLTIASSDLDAFSLTERESLEHTTVYSLASADLSGRNVADRQTQSATEYLQDHDLPPTDTHTHYTDTPSAGSITIIGFEYTHGRAAFTGRGERGTTAEDVGAQVADQAYRHYTDHNGIVDPYLGDQLLLYLALAGGELVIPERTAHVNTQLELLSDFGFDLTITEQAEQYHITA